jgi:pimeloyl-ACP methyl ester carboxylesterase
MYGNLFIYDFEYKLVAFESGSLLSSRCLILLGGLTDGLLSLPYVERFSSKLESLSKPYSLIQPLLRSSNLQYGWHTIDHDIQDLKTLINYLVKNRNDLESIILMGHSTGCQDIIHYLRQGEIDPKIVEVILQGPVSDRQYLSRLSSTKDQLNYCYQNPNNLNEWLPRYLHEPPLTIQRCLSLNQINSQEDLFSSDLTDEQLKNIYQNISIPILWIWSKQDEYVPDDIKDQIQDFIQNKLAKQTKSTFILLENADHAVTNEQQQIYMIEQIISSINKLFHDSF